jgi:outer membrane protein TolC
MKTFTLGLFLFISAVALQAQQIWELDTLVDRAFTKMQYQNMASAYDQSGELAKKNISNSWYPTLNLDGSFTYQNENISIPNSFNAPGFSPPEAPLNFNRLLLQINQTIYDGNMVSGLKRVEEAKYSVYQKQLEVEKIQLKAKITQLFMNALLVSKQSELLLEQRKVLDNQYMVMKNSFTSGATSTINLKLLQAELVQVDQAIVDSEFMAEKIKAQLSELCGIEISKNDALKMPYYEESGATEEQLRPEILLLEAQIYSMDAETERIGSNRLPKIGAFASLGAGSPGYDIFNSEVRPMAIVGLKLNWNIWDWNETHNQRQMLDLQKDILNSKKVQTQSQFQSEVDKEKLEMQKLQQLLQQDEEMIQLREEISEIKSSELQNGTITSSEYLVELTRENEAKLRHSMHQIQQVLSYRNYLLLQGK